MCPTNSVFVSLEENEKYSVIQAIWRHAPATAKILIGKKMESVRWQISRKQPIEHGEQPF